MVLWWYSNVLHIYFCIHTLPIHMFYTTGRMCLPETSDQQVLIPMDLNESYWVSKAGDLFSLPSRKSGQRVWKQPNMGRRLELILFYRTAIFRYCSSQAPGEKRYLDFACYMDCVCKAACSPSPSLSAWFWWKWLCWFKYLDHQIVFLHFFVKMRGKEEELIIMFTLHCSSDFCILPVIKHAYYKMHIIHHLN